MGIASDVDEVSKNVICAVDNKDMIVVVVVVVVVVAVGVVVAGVVAVVVAGVVVVRFDDAANKERKQTSQSLYIN